MPPDGILRDIKNTFLMSYVSGSKRNLTVIDNSLKTYGENIKAGV